LKSKLTPLIGLIKSQRGQSDFPFLIALFGEEAQLAIDAALNNVQRVIRNQDARATGHFCISNYQKVK
jgi:hypothetical protein